MAHTSRKNEASFPMPVWITDSKIDPSWVEEKVPHLTNVSDCTVKDISNDTRKGDIAKNGATLRLHISRENECDAPMVLVAKQIPPSGEAMSQRLGLAREAMFYNQLAPKIQLSSSNNEECIPKIYYSYGDMSNGSKFVLMEDLSDSFVDSGILFGPGNPNNWNRNLKSRIAAAYPVSVPTSFDVANRTFLAIANVHATFWKDPELLKEEYSWLRGSSWIKGKGKESWWASQSMIQNMWAKYNDEDGIGDGTERMEWDPLLRQIVSKAMKGISYEAHQRRLNTKSHYCLVHGDFWPGNIMISKDQCNAADNVGGRDLRLLDWEMVGIGSGPQDLGQYILSNMDPIERRGCGERLIRNYYEKLIQLGVKDLSWKDCWFEYKIGGLERWIWFLVYFCAQDGPVMAKWAQFFHNQIKEFVHDHGIRLSDVTQPRP